MALIVYYLNQGDRKNLYYLVLPPWCYLTHWKRKTSDQIKWSSFFNITIIKNVIPVIEFSDYEVLYGNHVDYIICFKYFVGDFVSSEEGNTAVSSSSDPTFNILSFEKCSSGGYKYKQICNNCEYNYSVIYSGKCTTMKGKNTECYGFPFITSYFASSIVDNLFSSYNDSILIKQGNSLLVPFVNELFEKNMEDILLFNEDLINEGNYYIRDILGTNNYISAHLRYNDFRKIVRYDLPPIHVAVGKLLYIMFINNINKIFISSDEKKQIEKVLNKQFNQYKDFFYFYDNTYLHDGHVAIIDQWICINAKIFVGNIFSRFSMHIKWERHLMNKREKGLNIDLCGYNINNDEQLRKNYKQVENLYDQEALHKLNHIFMNYSEKDKKYLNTRQRRGINSHSNSNSNNGCGSNNSSCGNNNNNNRCGNNNNNRCGNNNNNNNNKCGNNNNNRCGNNNNNNRCGNNNSCGNNSNNSQYLWYYPSWKVKGTLLIPSRIY
ncbi:GDP-fucose protein O-fucosyltransferase 2 [Plasmodium brasilianum]|uniref:GDP-fucose protein O-fucosyltransferase 2 n=1 Tax=Plasmodium brasilianum TaxID=5824 RepID=A0ACB9YDR6_PLABR|nr:GDP-fucose protein O-fucosyltransferase 2 [Plasmodium brasilianum]